MNTHTLSPRLMAIALLVPHGCRPADVGTDHGFIPAWLLKNGIVDRCSATDINRGPLAAAERTLSEAGVRDRAELFLCDGLAGCRPEDIDTIIIAGMGGDNIAGILERAPWAREGRYLILQPMSKAERLRTWLCASGYEITSESLVRDSGRLYPIITAEGSEKNYQLKGAELYTGSFRLISHDPLFPELTAELTEKFSRAIASMEKSDSDSSRLSGMKAILEELIKMQEVYENDNGKGD